MPLASGFRVADRYAVVGILGQGGMGAVYRAIDERLEREVAVKVLPSKRIGDATAVARLLREARAIAALEHANIVQVFDAGATHDGGAYLAMQLIEGRTLRARLADGPLPVAEAMSIVRQIGEALEHMHAAGIIHRDVKPDNVLLRSEDDRVVLVDLGLAKRDEAPVLTSEGTVVGTPAYLAPEQARGDDLDPRTDQFALATLTWELLTGRIPWRSISPTELVMDIVQREPPRMLVEGAPEEALRKALAKAREDRFESIGAFLDALEGRTTANRASRIESLGSAEADTPSLRRWLASMWPRR